MCSREDFSGGEWLSPGREFFGVGRPLPSIFSAREILEMGGFPSENQGLARVSEVECQKIGAWRVDGALTRPRPGERLFPFYLGQGLEPTRRVAGL